MAWARFRGEGNKKWTDSGCVPDSGPLGFADGLHIGFERMCSYRGLAQKDEVIVDQDQKGPERSRYMEIIRSSVSDL